MHGGIYHKLIEDSKSDLVYEPICQNCDLETATQTMVFEDKTYKVCRFCNEIFFEEMRSKL